MTRAGNNARTTRLATARLEFRDDRRFTKVLLLAAVTALTFLLVLIGRQVYVDSRESGDQLAGLKRENATLRADLGRATTELTLERSTRAALVRQVAALNEEKTQLARRLDFIEAQTGRSGKTR